MSKVNQIEKSINELEGGRFQKLCDSFISLKEKVLITGTGSQDGTDKTVRGTPDSYYVNNNGQYVFIESTTQQTELLQKMQDDIKKCFDTSITHIPVDKIDSIVYFHVKKLLPHERLTIYELCEAAGCKLINYDASSLSQELAYQFPQIARDYLNISIDINQILIPKYFIEEKSRTITLNNKFYYREKEIQDIYEALGDIDLVIITGNPGTGKTRIALQVIEKYLTEHPNYNGYCIENRSAEIETDFIDLYSSQDSIILLIDDANRLTQLNMILSYIDLNPHKLKILITIRNYALKTITEAMQNKPYKQISINNFNRAQIKEIISDASIGIHNPLFIDRICDVSKGNGRLAVMAAQVAIQENRLSSLVNTIKIYDSYFRDLNSIFTAGTCLKIKQVLGIISYFQFIDMSSPPCDLYTNFQIPESEFWEAILQLYNYEIVDLYENQVCKISDQVIATYYFYKIVLEEKLISFEIFLTNYFSKKYVGKMKDTIFPIANTFDFNRIIQIIKVPIEQQWELLFHEQEYKALYDYASTFYFVIPYKVLNYTNMIIDSAEIDTEKLIFTSNYHGITDKVYELLNRLIGLYPSNNKMSLQLACKYFLKCNSKAHDFLEFILLSFKYNPNVIQYSVETQKELFTTLFQQAGENDLINLAIVYIAPNFLKMEHEDSYSEGMNYTISYFALPFNSMIQELHDLILSYTCNFCLDRYIEFLDRYYDLMRAMHVTTTTELRKALLFDSKYVVDYMIKHFSFEGLRHNTYVNKYKELLEQYKVDCEALNKLVQSANTDLFKVYSILNMNPFDRLYIKSEETSYQEIQEKHKALIAESIKNFSLQDYIILLESIEHELQSKQSQNNYNLVNSIEKMLEVLTRDRELFLEIIRYVIEHQNVLNLTFYTIPSFYLKAHPQHHLELYKVISEKQYKNKDQWNYYFFSTIFDTFFSNIYYDEFKIFIRKIFIDWNFFFDCFMKLEQYKEGSFIVFLEILYSNRTQNNVSFSILFNPYSDINKDIFLFFENNTELLKKIYLYQISRDPGTDHSGAILGKLLSQDPQFIIGYLETVYSKLTYVSDHIGHPNFECIWLLDNYTEIIIAAFDYIEHKESFVNDGIFLNSFFEITHETDRMQICDRQQQFLYDLIQSRSSDYYAMNLIFRPIKKFFWEEMPNFAFAFLERSNSLEAIKSISFNYEFYTGDYTFLQPFNRMLSFWKKLQETLDDIKFIEIKNYIDEQIISWEERITIEKRKQFVGYLDYL